MEQLAIALHCCGEFKRSLKFFQALKSFQDDGTPESARLWNSIGCVQFNLLRGSFALQCFTRTVYSPKATYLTRAIARANLGHAQLSHGLKHDGGQSLRLAVEVRKPLFLSTSLPPSSNQHIADKTPLPFCDRSLKTCWTRTAQCSGARVKISPCADFHTRKRLDIFMLLYILFVVVTVDGRKEAREKSL